MNLKLFGAVALLAACLAASYSFGLFPFEPDLELNHARFYSIKNEIGRTPHAVIVLGDSIVEGATLPDALCGYPIVNAGVVGAGIEYFQRHATELLGPAHPRLIVLAVGINNANPIAEKQFRLNYQKTVASLAGVAPVAVATITPVRSGRGSEGYDATLVPKLNDIIKTTPNAMAVIDLNGPLSGANWTSDGIHLGSAGNELWTKAMVDGVRDILNCPN